MDHIHTYALTLVSHSLYHLRFTLFTVCRRFRKYDNQKLQEQKREDVVCQLALPYHLIKAPIASSPKNNKSSYLHTYIHTYMHAYIHIYIHTHTLIYAYIHTYIHTYSREMDDKQSYCCAILH